MISHESVLLQIGRAQIFLEFMHDCLLNKPGSLELPKQVLTVQQMMSSSQVQRRRRICLFGTSGDPPTGDGGHATIVRTLSSLTIPISDPESSLYYFDQVWVLPVFQHMYSVCFPKKYIHKLCSAQGYFFLTAIYLFILLMLFF